MIKILLASGYAVVSSLVISRISGEKQVSISSFLASGVLVSLLFFYHECSAPDANLATWGYALLGAVPCALAVYSYKRTNDKS